MIISTQEESSQKQTMRAAWWVGAVCLGLGGLALSIGLVGPSSQAQGLKIIAPGVAPGADGKDDEKFQILPRTRLDVDRLVSRKVEEAARFIEIKQYDIGFEILQGILDRKNDVFVTASDDKMISARQRVYQIIEGSNKEGLENYRSLYGDEAATLFARGVRDRDPIQIAEVMQRFFHTQAGKEAANWLASFKLDQGQPGLALMYMNRVINSPSHQTAIDRDLLAKRAVALTLAGGPEGIVEAQSIFADMGGKAPFAKGSLDANELIAQLGGADVRGAQIASAGDWIALGGGAGRTRNVPKHTGNIELTFDRIVGYHAMYPVPSDPNSGHAEIIRWHNAFKGFRDQIKSSQRVPMIDSMVLGVDDAIYFRDTRGLVGMGLNDGKRLPAGGEDSLHGGFAPSLTKDSQMNNPYNRGGGRMIINGRYVNVNAAALGIADSVYGNLSTDGEFFYAIQEATVEHTGGANPNPRRINYGYNIIPVRANHLVAMKRVANAGGGTKLAKAWEFPPKSKEEDGKTPFFLGPPLPVGELLFAMAEESGELRVYCLNPNAANDNDRLVWSQLIAVPDKGLNNDVHRRTQAVHLAYSDGILVCPTNQDRVVAIDPLTREFVWDFHYGSDPVGSKALAAQYNNLYRNRRNAYYNQQMISHPYHTDPPVIYKGQVFVSSDLGRFLYNIDIATGELNWKVDRMKFFGIDGWVEKNHGFGVFAGIFNDQVILLGNEGAMAYSASPSKKPEVLWSSALNTDGQRISGYPAADDKFLYVPMTDGSIIQVEFSSGRIMKNIEFAIPTAEFKSVFHHPKNCGGLGNLYLHKDKLIACGMAGVFVFDLNPPAAE